ncbi:helix-turn-helix transcriptional regulator [Paenibacillus lycopersici]|uniref:Helix-turn-helix transcriptional regulator n=1 Tax=Paenibacillus lycopersici TaxID=2704462 RepID=A0A6C0FTA0_9BACL|nr:AraC family transcriptional regulator [Paenibacillus lycopersici]QHT59242.1 helix-turn-helix transcriptional regulator [Paenibacillus lycopersici]
MSRLQFTVPPMPHYMLCGPVTYEPGRRHVSRRNIGVFDLLVVREGCLYMGEEEQTFNVEPGCALILRPDTSHYGTQGCKERTSYYWLHFQTTGSWTVTDDELPRHGLEPYDEKRTQAMWSYSTHTFQIQVPQFVKLLHPSKMDELFEQLIQLNQHFYSGSAKWSQQVVFQDVLRELSASMAKEESTPAAVCAALAAEYLRKHYREPITAQELGERLNFHPVYIARCMQRSYGCAPMEYLMHHRIEQAKLLLLQTDLAVARIAEEVGFNQAAYFTSCFTRTEGISPRQFRQRFYYG